jgi:hypothetical protein
MSPDSKTAHRFALVPLSARAEHHRVLGAVERMLVVDGLPYMPRADSAPSVVVFATQCARLADDTTASDDLRRAAIKVMGHAIKTLRHGEGEL